MKKPKHDSKPYRITAKGSETVKSFSQKREGEFAKEIGGRLTPNSGSTPHTKGDVLSTDKMFDLKSTKSNQIIVTVSMLKKLLDDASRVGRDPVLVLDFPNSDLKNKKWICIPIEDFNG